MALTKKDIREIFKEGLEKLVIPQLNAIYEKLQNHGKQLNDLQEGQDKILRKMTVFEDRFDSQSIKLSDHEESALNPFNL